MGDGEPKACPNGKDERKHAQRLAEKKKVSKPQGKGVTSKNWGQGDRGSQVRPRRNMEISLKKGRDARGVQQISQRKVKP